MEKNPLVLAWRKLTQLTASPASIHAQKLPPELSDKSPEIKVLIMTVKRPILNTSGSSTCKTMERGSESHFTHIYQHEEHMHVRKTFSINIIRKLMSKDLIQGIKLKI